MPNTRVRNEVRETMLRGFSFGVPEKDWKKFKINKYQYPDIKNRPNDVYKAINKELRAGTMFIDNKIQPLLITPIFLKDESDKIRPIYDYSFTFDGINSLNSLIPTHDKGVEFNLLTDLVQFIDNDGKNKYMGKNDGSAFFRQIPLKPKEWRLAVYCIDGNYIVDTRMPWGTARAPKIAHYLSLAIEYIAYKYIPRSMGTCIFSYVDDHIFAAATQLQVLYIHIIYIKICQKAGIKLKHSKTVLAEQVIIGLGFEFDLINRTISVPQTKVTKYLKNFKQILQQTRATAKQLQSTTGKMQHVQLVLWPLRVYCRHIYNAIPPYKSEKQIVPITQKIKNCIKAWIKFMPLIKGVKLQTILKQPTTYTHTTTTDGSDIGYGGFSGKYWFYDKYYSSEVNPNNEYNIRDRELYPILTLFNTLGPIFTGANIRIMCDNQNAVQALTNKDIRNNKSQDMLIEICELAMKYKFRFYAFYIKSSENILADALSRLKIQTFKQLVNLNNLDFYETPLLFQRIPFDFGNGPITIFDKILYN